MASLAQILRVSKSVDVLGRVVIPASMRHALAIGAGKEAGEEAEVMLELHTDCIVIKKMVPNDPCPTCGRPTA